MVAKSKPMMSLVSKTANLSPTLGSDASGPGTLGIPSSSPDRTNMEKPVAKGLNENTASSSQVWHSDENTNTSIGKPVAETINIVAKSCLISNVDHLEKVFSTVRQKLSRLQGGQNAKHRRQRDDLGNLDVSDYEGDSNRICDTVRYLAEIDPEFGISTIEWNAVPWKRTTLPHDRSIKLSNAKVHVYSGSVLCLGKIHEHPQLVQH